MSQQPAFDPVQQGVSLALDAHRRGFVDDRALDALLAYYDAEGAVDPFPPAEVLTRIGGVSAEQLRALFGQAPARTPSEIQGQRFGDRLTLLEPIGEGGMGTVYRAYDRVLKRVVAVKRVRVDQLEGASKTRALSRFEREAMAMARVRHPACVQIFDAGLTKQGEPYLVMEFVAGKSLRAVVEEHHTPGSRPLDPRQVATWGAAIADALQACHDVGLVHRDVKPANVLLDAQRHPRLTDFGVALDDTARTKLTVDKAMVGTLTYMAPEQALGEAVDARSDLYALGATLYELLTGRPPFDGVSALVLMRQVLSVEPAPLRKLAPGVPVDLETIVMKCLAKAADDRYATAQALSLDLRRYLADEPVLARPVSASRRLARRLWRARRLVGAVGALAVGGLVLAGAAHVRAREAQRARIDAALEAAAIASDIDAAEQEVLSLVAIAAPEQAERAREALRQLRGRRRLREAEAAFERWKEATARAKALLEEADALKERIDPRQPYAESEDKKRLVELDEEALRTREAAQLELVELERSLAQSSVDLPGPDLETFRARVFLARAREHERDDPDLAERLFVASEAHAEDGGMSLRVELAHPRILVSSDLPGEVVLERFGFDRDVGYMVPKEVARGSSPCELVGLGAGAYRVTIRSIGCLPVHDVHTLTRGERREVHFSPVPARQLQLLASEIVHVPAGPARWGARLQVQCDVDEFFLRRDEVSYEEWHSFQLATGEREAPFLPRDGGTKLELNPAQRRQWPVVGVTWAAIQRFVAWHQAELDLAGIPLIARLPEPEEFHRAVRGGLSWCFPWGRIFEPSLCEVDGGIYPQSQSVVERLLGRARHSDVSPFRIRRLAGHVAEWINVSGSAGSIGAHCMQSRFTAEVRLLGPTLEMNADRVKSPVLGLRFAYKRSPSRVSGRSNRSGAKGASAEPLHVTPDARAQEELTHALNTDSAAGHLWKNRGLVRGARGDFWGAVWDYSVALSLLESSEHATILLDRGLAHLARGDLSAAFDDLSHVLELRPSSMEAWAARAMVRLEQGEVREALADFDAALKIDPRHEAINRARAEAAARLR